MMGGIQARDLTVCFGSITAVDRVTLHVEPGRLLAVTGPSGAGKSSLLGALAGVYPLSGGNVGPIDSSTNGWRLEDAIAHGIALVPQGNGLIQLLTASENVLLPLKLRRSRHASDVASAALTAVGLQDSATQYVGELSGGQQQRLALARALAQQPGVILADEPTSELDAANRTRVIALLKAEAHRGAAIVIATHDREAADACDAELCLRDGHAAKPNSRTLTREQHPTLPHSLLAKVGACRPVESAGTVGVTSMIDTNDDHLASIFVQSEEHG